MSESLPDLVARVRLDTTDLGSLPSVAATAGVGLGAGIAAGAAAAVAALAAVGAGLYSVGSTFDDVNDTLRVNTGASGEALFELGEVARQVGATVPASFEQISPVVADLNTRLGLSGDTLQTVASQYLEAGRILGEDVDVQGTSAAFSAFRIEGEAVAGAMDTLFQVSQATGVGMNELASAVQANAPAVQALGFSFEETTALVGSLDKAGLNSTQTLAAMQRGLVNLAQDGEAPQEAFRRITGQISDLVEQGRTAEAIDLASGVFGTRGAAQFVGAVQSGSLALDDLMGAVGATGDTILGLGQETRDAAESWQILKNNALLALEPLGNLVFGAVGDVLGQLVPLAQTASETMRGFFQDFDVSGVFDAFAPIFDALAPIGDAVRELAPAFGQLIPTVLQVASAFSPMHLILQAVLPVLPQIAAVVSDVVTTVLGAVQPLLPVLAEIVGTIGGALGTVVAAVVPIIGRLAEIVGGVLTTVLAALTPLLTLVADLVAQLLPVIVSLLEPVFGIVEALLPIVEVIGTLIGTLLPPIVELISAILVPVAGLVSALVEALAPILELVAGLLTTAVVPILTVLIGVVAEVIGWVLELAGPALTWLVEQITNLLGWVLGGVEAFATWLAEGIAWGEFFTAAGAWFSDLGATIGAWWASVTGWFGQVGATIGGWATNVGSWFASVGAWFSRLGQTVSSWGAALGRVIGTAVGYVAGFASEVSRRIGEVIGFFTGLPGRILSALGNLGTLLLQAGRNVIQGLIDGIEQMAGRVADTVGRVVRTIRDFLPFSPAKRGPLSGSGSPDRAGAQIGAMLADGMLGQVGSITDAAGILASAAGVDVTVGLGSNLNRGDVGSNTTPRAPVVKVYIGETELRGIVRTEVVDWTAGEVDLALLGGE